MISRASPAVKRRPGHRPAAEAFDTTAAGLGATLPCLGLPSRSPSTSQLGPVSVALYPSAWHTVVSFFLLRDKLIGSTVPSRRAAARVDYTRLHCRRNALAMNSRIVNTYAPMLVAGKEQTMADIR